jgi:hypothetical protein
MPRNATFLGFNVFAAVLLIAVLLGAGLADFTGATGLVESPRDTAGPVSSSFRFAKSPADRPEAEPAPPIGLTASDGTGLAWSPSRRTACSSRRSPSPSSTSLSRTRATR